MSRLIPHHFPMTHEEQIARVGEKIKGLRTCMFTTMTKDGLHRGRPMATQDIEFDGTVWFMTSKESEKVKDVMAHEDVALLYGDNGTRFVSLSGTASLVDDRAKIKEFWTDFYKAWFENEDDPSIVLIKVAVSRAEYWDYPGGKAGAFADMALSSVTGKQMDHGENEVIDFA